MVKMRRTLPTCCGMVQSLETGRQPAHASKQFGPGALVVMEVSPTTRANAFDSIAMADGRRMRMMITVSLQYTVCTPTHTRGLNGTPKVLLCSS